MLLLTSWTTLSTVVEQWFWRFRPRPNSTCECSSWIVIQSDTHIHSQAYMQTHTHKWAHIQTNTHRAAYKWAVNTARKLHYKQKTIICKQNSRNNKLHRKRSETTGSHTCLVIEIPIFSYFGVLGYLRVFRYFRCKILRHILARQLQFAIKLTKISRLSSFRDLMRDRQTRWPIQ